MNERHPSGYAPDYDAHAYDAYSQGAYQTVGTTFSAAAYGEDTTGGYGYAPQTPDQTPPPGPGPQYDQSYAYGYGYDTGYATGYDQTATFSTIGYTSGGYDTGSYDTGSYDTGGYDTGTYAAYDPYAYTAVQQPTGATYYDTGTFDTSALWQGGQQQEPQPPAAAPPYPQQQDWDSGAYPVYGYGYGYDASGDTGVYEQVAAPYEPQAAEPEAPAAPAPAPDPVHETPDPYADVLLDTYEADLLDTAGTAHDDEPVRHDYASDGPAGDGVPVARSRRRKPAKRSALLTVAVPSVAVMGVAAVGAAAVTGVGMAQESPKAQADGQGQGSAANAPTTQLDRQLAGVSRDADDFATRASRTQERIDLKDRQAAAKRARAAAAARKEALRPKFVLPVTERGLSAYFGQAGVNWMALHTGIDFPVQVGTPVMAVTDGTVRTQWNSSYGNMAIVTAPDGTETWYCHLSSTKIRSGSVKAGTVIAYSGNTGNTTGPHLHLEVRPGGGAPIDPLAWLLSHGLDPR